MTRRSQNREKSVEIRGGEVSKQAEQPKKPAKAAGKKTVRVESEDRDTKKMAAAER